MTEREKMLSSIAYNPADAELLERWHYAKSLQVLYNNTDSKDTDHLNKILDELIGSRGKNVWITAPIYVDYGNNIHLGNNVEINLGCTFLDCAAITIGDGSGIAPNVQIYTVFHPVDPNERLTGSKENQSPFWECIAKPVTIGSNVWIGGGSIILPGVTIGDNTTIGAGSVVTHSIPDHVVAVGNPCRVIKVLK